MKNYRRTRTSKVIGGVCGGIGEYLQIDPVIIRLLFAASLFIGGAGFVIYMLAWIIVPKED